MERLIRVTKECTELQWDRWQALDSGHPAVLARHVDWDGLRVVTLHIVSAELVVVTLNVDAGGEEVFGPRSTSVGSKAGRIPLGGPRE